MSEHERSRCQREYDALPQWARQIVDGLRASFGYGSAGGAYETARALTVGWPSEARAAVHVSSVSYFKDKESGWKFEAGMDEARELARSLSAPWPPPEAPKRERRVLNLVEMVNDDMEDGGFNQPCAFGSLVPGHSVYCHNDGWPDSPRKCHRSWYTGGNVRDEDCPGYVPNPDYRPEPKEGERL